MPQPDDPFRLPSHPGGPSGLFKGEPLPAKLGQDKVHEFLQTSQPLYSTAFVPYTPRTSVENISDDDPTDDGPTPTLTNTTTSQSSHSPSSPKSCPEPISPTRAQAYGTSLTTTLTTKVPRSTQMGILTISQVERPSAEDLSREIMNNLEELDELRAKAMITLLRETLTAIAWFCGFLSVHDPDYIHGNVSRQKWVNWIIGDNKINKLQEFFRGLECQKPNDELSSRPGDRFHFIRPTLRLLHGQLNPSGKTLQGQLNEKVHGLSFSDMVEVCTYLKHDGWSKLGINVSEPQPTTASTEQGAGSVQPPTLLWYTKDQYVDGLKSVISIMRGAAEQEHIDAKMPSGVKTWIEKLRNNPKSWWSVSEWIKMSDDWVTLARTAQLDAWAVKAIERGQLPDQAQLILWKNQLQAEIADKDKDIAELKKWRNESEPLLQRLANLLPASQLEEQD